MNRINTNLGKKAENVLSLHKKSGFVYVFFYDDESVPKLLEQLGKYASDPDLEFTWYDAAILADRAKEIEKHI